MVGNHPRVRVIVRLWLSEWAVMGMCVEGFVLGSREVAVEILKLVSGFDARIRSLSTEDKRMMTEAWTLAFDGKVWPEEGRRAVVEHYSKSNAFPIMPGDVITYCAKQPPWSSEDHARAFLLEKCNEPYSPVITDFTGICTPVFKVPEGDQRSRKAWEAEKLHAWVVENMDRLIAGLMSRRKGGTY